MIKSIKLKLYTNTLGFLPSLKMRHSLERALMALNGLTAILTLHIIYGFSNLKI